ncbi:MAG TPA: metal-dependent hydrolase [Vicinamibacterales bacterium]|nr:metal-dependent hydrolase [Vicinamibacterales bacterium]
MDNVCHTLVGAAFGEAGLKTRTRFGNPVLMIAANLPDVDVLSRAAETSVAIRRGITHGVIAQALLPILLTGVVLLLDLWRPPRHGRDRARAAPLLLLSYVGVLSHVALDWLNNYGIRLLMPFSGRWFYGDSVFIIDPWLWLALGVGVWLARRRAWPSAATVSLVVATVYIAGMVMSAQRAREHVVRSWSREHGRAPEALMVAPVFGNPFRRTVILDAGAHYRTGTLTWWPMRVTYDAAAVPKNADAPAAVRARADPRVRAVLVWARFPFYRMMPVEGGTRVTVADMRFAGRVGDLSIVVPETRD